LSGFFDFYLEYNFIIQCSEFINNILSICALPKERYAHWQHHHRIGYAIITKIHDVLSNDVSKVLKKEEDECFQYKCAIRVVPPIENATLNQQ
jgi:hypothetical protein